MATGDDKPDGERGGGNKAAGRAGGVLGRLRARLLGAGRGGGAAPLAPPSPDEPLAIVGDIHGRADLLDRLLADPALDPAARRLVFVGDYVDRGPDSRGVIDRVMALTRDAGAVALLGNHERMMLDFLARPAAGAGWLGVGGLETVESFGLDATDGPVEALAERLARALGPERLDWLSSRPRLWRSGNVVVVHGGMDPDRPPEAQPEEVLLWQRPRGVAWPRPDGLWVAFGHTPRAAPEATEGRIAVDTGAFATGRLTAALVDPDGKVRFVATSG